MAGAALRASFFPDAGGGIAAFRKCAADHVMANADFLLNEGEGSAPGAHLHHHVEFFGRKGHAPGALSIRQLLAVRCPAGIGGDICPLRGGQFLALFLRHGGPAAGIAAPVVAAIGTQRLGAGASRVFRAARMRLLLRVAGDAGVGATVPPGASAPPS